MLFQKKNQTEPKSSKEKKQEKVAQKSIQDLIPIKDIEQGLLITPDLKMVQFLKVSVINLELTSNAECNEIFESYEGFLMTLVKPIQTTNVSMPVDLKSYIKEKKNQYKGTVNKAKRMLQDSYIQYASDIENRQDIFQRQRYIIFSEQMKSDTPKSRHETALELEERTDEIKSLIAELGLVAEEVKDLDIIRYLHTMFDYQGAQTRPVYSKHIPQMITGGKNDEE